MDGGSGGGSKGGERPGGAKAPSEREVVNYIRKEKPDVPKLFKHFKRVRLLLYSSSV